MIVDYWYALTVMWAIFCAENFRIVGYKISLNLPLNIDLKHVQANQILKCSRFDFVYAAKYCNNEYSN